MRNTIKYFKEAYDYRDLLYYLTIKELKLKYKNSLLGVAWSLLNPLMMIVVYTIAFKYILRIEVENYALFVFTGLLPWIFFQTSVSQSASTIVSHGSLISKVYFPRSFLPISLVLSNFINYLFTLIILFGAMLYFRVEFTYALFLLPIFLLMLLLFVMGFALLISAVTTKYRDIAYLIEVIFGAWFYLTPIIYPISLVPDKFLPFILSNPFTSIINSFRDIIIEGVTPQAIYMYLFLIYSISFYVIGIITFRKREKHFVDEI